MKKAYSTINQVLVTLFNSILRIEENALRTRDLSIREIHVIEAVCQAKDSRMTALAQSLHITTGSMSVAVSTLERKGYLRRERQREDKRVIDIRPTEKALEVEQQHEAFHREMTNAVIDILPPGELAVLMKALDGIDHYFSSKEMESQ